MPQQVRALAAMPDNLSSLSGPRLVKKRDLAPTGYRLISTIDKECTQNNTGKQTKPFRF